MAAQVFEERQLAVSREKITSIREVASRHRRQAEDNYRRGLVVASRWELFASLLEQGYSLEEAQRRAFHPRVEQ